MDTAAGISATTAVPANRPRLSGLNQRRWELFRGNKRGFWSLWIFLALFFLSLFAELFVNDRPIIASYKGELLFPIFSDYPEDKFGGFLATTDFRDPFIQQEVSANGWMIWPPIRYGYRTVNNELPKPAPSPPVWRLSDVAACARYPLALQPGSDGTPHAARGLEDPNCIAGNMNWLGTDDQGRDVIARMIHGFRISVIFGLILTLLSSILGVAAGAVQGYFGGWTDLTF